MKMRFTAGTFAVAAIGVSAAILVSTQGCSGATSPSGGTGSGSSGAQSTGTTSSGSLGASGSASGSSAGGASGTSAGSTANLSGNPISGSTAASGTSSGASGSTSTGQATSGGNAAAGQSGGVDAAAPPSDAAAPPQEGGPTPIGPSAGCGKIPTQAMAQYVNYKINIAGLPAKYAAMYAARNYYVWLPMGYDPSHAYTTVFLGPGCGGNGSQVLPMQNASKTNAILVGLSPVGQCFMTSAADSPEVPFFDAVLSDVESNFCVDRAHVFVAGFSSGSWLSNLLGCARAGILRGQGNATGGLPAVPACSGPIAAMLAHDQGDTANNITGGEAARDRILKMNGCSLTATVPYDAGRPSMCVAYQNCPAAYPVVWCPTTGQGHSDQVSTGLSVPGFWNFWEALP